MLRRRFILLLNARSEARKLLLKARENSTSGTSSSLSEAPPFSISAEGDSFSDTNSFFSYVGITPLLAEDESRTDVDLAYQTMFEAIRLSFTGDHYSNREQAGFLPALALVWNHEAGYLTVSENRHLCPYIALIWEHRADYATTTDPAPFMPASAVCLMVPESDNLSKQENSSAVVAEAKLLSGEYTIVSGGDIGDTGEVISDSNINVAEASYIRSSADSSTDESITLSPTRATRLYSDIQSITTCFAGMSVIPAAASSFHSNVASRTDESSMLDVWEMPIVEGNTLYIRQSHLVTQEGNTIYIT